MIAVAVAEAVALMIGASMLHWHDGAAADPPDGFVGDALGWLHFGKVPMLVILVIFLTTFALAGFVAQFVARGMIGAFLPVPAAAAIAPGGRRVRGSHLRRGAEQGDPEG
jgi:Inner membrane protein YqiJ, N-terminal